MNSALHQFTVDELRENTEDDTEFQKFVRLRKELTTYYKSGQNIIQHINTYKDTGKLNIISVQSNIIPNTLPRTLQKTFLENIQKTADLQNIQALHELIKQNLAKGCEIEDMMKEYSNFVIAKAFRTVTLANKELSDGAIKKKQEYVNAKRDRIQLDEEDRSIEHDNHMQHRQERFTRQDTRKKYSREDDYHRQRTRNNEERLDYRKPVPNSKRFHDRHYHFPERDESRYRSYQDKYTHRRYGYDSDPEVKHDIYPKTRQNYRNHEWYNSRNKPYLN